MMRFVPLFLVLLAAARPALAQCPDGSMPRPDGTCGRRAAATPAGPKPFTIVSELDGTAPADVRAAARNIVASALDESTVLAALPVDQIRLGLILAGRDSLAQLDLATARELAVRGSVRTVFTGTIDQVGRTYHTAVRVIDADSNTVLAVGRGIARGEDDLIPTLDRVVRAVRASLGEQRAAIRASRPLMQAATPSFAAYLQYRRGAELNLAGEFRGAADALRAALALDTGFAAAWRLLAAVYSNLTIPDSAWMANEAALDRQARLVAWQRFNAEGRRALRLGDYDAAIAAFDQERRLGSGSPQNLGDLLDRIGRYAEAVALWEEWERSAPFGLRPAQQRNFATYLLAVGRFDEARRRAATIPGDLGIRTRLWVAVWTADWTGADSLAPMLLERSTRNPGWRIEALVAQASAAAARGRVREALSVLRNLRSTGRLQTELVLRLAGGLPVTAPESGGMPPDAAAYDQVEVALWEAAAGDTAAAREIVTRVLSLPAAERVRTDEQVTLLEAWLATAAGHFSEAVRLLRPLTERGTLFRWGLTQRVRWTLADSYERLGQLDSAAAVLERLAAWQGASSVDVNQRGLTHPFVHQRLVMLYARMGRAADARRHWRVFSETFTNPDPEMVHLVDEARAALASAERRD